MGETQEATPLLWPVGVRASIGFTTWVGDRVVYRIHADVIRNLCILFS